MMSSNGLQHHLSPPMLPPLVCVSIPQLKYSSKTVNILSYLLTLFIELKTQYGALARLVLVCRPGLKFT